MDVRTAQSRLDDALFLDVREPYEWAAGHIEGALHIPIGAIAERFEEIPRTGEVIVVCQIGQRSALVADFLTQQGYAAHNMEGGLEAWVSCGFSVTVPKGIVVDGWARDLTGRRLKS